MDVCSLLGLKLRVCYHTVEAQQKPGNESDGHLITGLYLPLERRTFAVAIPEIGVAVRHEPSALWGPYGAPTER
jgi:hypothetical protein